MIVRPKPHAFHPGPPDAAGIVSWVQMGDLHMRAASDQNHIDLQAIVRKINESFADSVSFVFLPGDHADHGDSMAYGVLRSALDRLEVPWCAIVGDHDVEQKSFDNFTSFMAPDVHYAFTIGNVRFVALNAFDVPEPSAFTVGQEQLRWLAEQLEAATGAGLAKVLLLHCYPSDLKQGREELVQLSARHGVKLIAMGHTHYNEISNDGRTIYTATRSTGQVEEGPVGYSVTNLDDGILSWRFFELGAALAVIITTPIDERLVAEDVAPGDSRPETLVVRAKVWSKAPTVNVKATFGKETAFLVLTPGTKVWEGKLPMEYVEQGFRALRVEAEDRDGNLAFDEILVPDGSGDTPRERKTRDQDNAVGAWPEHGLLGTQLGPNKHGRKW